MACRTLAHGPFRGSLVIRQRMMPEGVVTPSVRLGIFLTVFDLHIDSVVRAISIPASGRLRARAGWERWVKNRGQFFYNDSSVWKLACLQIGMSVFLLYIPIISFGEVRLVTAPRRLSVL